MSIFVDKSADIDPRAKIGEGTKIWNNAQVREYAVIGKNCMIGKDVYIDHHVVVGDNCKIQNQALLYNRLEIGNNVFIGPQVCFANDRNPRAVGASSQAKKSRNWNVGRIRVKEGASVGAGSILIPNITIGKWAMIGAGSVVTKDISDYELVFGSPAIVRGYVCQCGKKISKPIKNNLYICKHRGHKISIK